MAESIDALKRALSSKDDYISWSARRIVLTSLGPNVSFPAKERADFLRRNIETEHLGRLDRYEHDDGYIRFYEAASADGSLVQDENVSQLIEIMETANLSGANAEAARTLLAAARWRPHYVLSQRDRLNKLPGRGFTPNQEVAELHDLVLAALARADYEVKKSLGTTSLSSIRSLLETRTDAEQRMFGTYAAYLSWLDRPGERVAIEQELRALAAGPEPELRISANQALEMIWVGRLTLTDLDRARNPRGLTRARLDLLVANPEPHIASAARISMEKWLDATSAKRPKG
jgi:hypothetical protein